MTEYDAFGREKGENTLAGLGSSAPSTPTPSTKPTQAPVQAQAPVTPEAPRQAPASSFGTGGPAPSFGGSRVGNRLLKATVAVVVLFVVGGFVSLIIGAVSTGVSTVNKTRKAFNDITIPTISTPAGITTTPTGTPSAGGSLLRRDQFAQALSRLRAAKATGPARTLRVDATRVTGQLSGPGGQLVFVNVTPNSTQTITTSANAPSALRAIPLRTIDPAAPQRIAGALRARGGRVNYLVLTAIAGGPRWTVFSTQGRQYRADRHGRGLVAGP